MSFSRATIAGVIIWMLTITLLHWQVNVGGWKFFASRDNFRVGFLPVT